MNENGIKVIDTQEDAEPSFVKTAVQAARTSTILVVGEDTDLLVLLLYHATSHGVFFIPEMRKKQREVLEYPEN